jgi:hypothetical protein
MNIVIEHSNTKRVIKGPFNLCGSHVELRSIAEQILAQIDDGYGWIMIQSEVQKSLANTRPKEWDSDNPTT